MPRALLFLGLVASQAAPVHAGRERANIAVSLQVVPSCAAKVERSAGRNGSPALKCSTEPARSRSAQTPPPAYTVHTYRSAANTVVSYEF